MRKVGIKASRTHDMIRARMRYVRSLLDMSGAEMSRILDPAQAQNLAISVESGFGRVIETEVVFRFCKRVSVSPNYLFGFTKEPFVNKAARQAATLVGIQKKVKMTRLMQTNTDRTKFAASLNMTYPHLSNVENSVSVPNVEALANLAALRFGGVDYFFNMLDNDGYATSRRPFKTFKPLNPFKRQTIADLFQSEDKEYNEYIVSLFDD